MRNINTIISADQQLQGDRNKLATLENQNEGLEAQDQQSDSAIYKEGQIRDGLGMAKPGEKVLVLPSEDTLRKLSPVIVNPSQDSLPDPIWKQWVKLFL